MTTTGIKDKNGVEIKEGDRVLFHHPKSGLTEGPYYFYYCPIAFRWVAHLKKKRPVYWQDCDVLDIAYKYFYGDTERCQLEIV